MAAQLRRRTTLSYDESDDDEDFVSGGVTTDAVLPERGDNAAIARIPLAKGAVVAISGRDITLATGCPEGWRFAARPQNSITCTGERSVAK